MQPDDYIVFKEWYETQKHITDWEFKAEMIKYCRSDIEVLSTAVLAFRKLFKENLDVDPFRYITLPSLCMHIFRTSFLPDKSIVANDSNKNISRVSREWFIHMNDPNIKREVPLFMDQTTLEEFDTHAEKNNYYASESTLGILRFV